MPRANPRRVHSIGYATGRRKRKLKRNNRLAVIVTACIVLVCGFWILGFRFYTVTSNSMAPTLQGSVVSRDKILCWMLPYLYREPVRWEVIAFNTPTQAENRKFGPFDTGGETGMTVKRIVGLPGERLAMHNGDIWIRPLSGSVFHRLVKPDSIQRSLWIAVYGEDFSDPDLEAFRHYWQSEGKGELELEPSAAVKMTPGPTGQRIVFQPRARVGHRDSATEMVLPGVPDRYVLEQDIYFRCRNENCRENFFARISDQKIIARCPACRTLNFETDVVFYSLRSGLPETGPYYASYLVQGDEKHFRNNSYFMVPDLRIRLQLRLETPNSECRVTLDGEEGEATLRVTDGGMEINGIPVAGVRVEAGRWTEIEFYRVDGAVRLFVDDGKQAAFDRVFVQGEMGEPENSPVASGVSIEANGGELSLRVIHIDRDIYYFSGREMGIASYHTGMEPGGQIDIPPGCFFPLGDNTTVSLDGRSWGAVPESLLQGTAVAIWRPDHRRAWISQPSAIAAAENK